MNNLHKTYTPKDVSFFEKHPISIKSISNPKVSIIIPVYNHIDYTLNCLYSLQKECEDHDVEIIVVNDCSTDSTLEHLNQVKGIKVINNETNLGFLKNINKGVKAATGTYVLLFNNDIIIVPGLLKELFRVFETKPNVGAVGCMAIHPTGVILEAGSTMFSDGSAANLGRECLPDDPRFHFVKSVDYCSGYCLLVKRYFPNGELVQLDEHFLPAYYEETDLCMRIRHEHKMDIYYQPFAKLIHFESISYGKEKSSKKERLMQANKAKFFEKWKTVLTKQPFDTFRLDQAYLNKNYTGNSLLILDDCITDSLIESLLVKEKVTKKVALLIKDKQRVPRIEELQRNGVEVLYPFTSSKGKKYTYFNLLRKTVLAYNVLETNSALLKFYHKIRKK